MGDRKASRDYRSGLPNPYANDSADHEAYARGYAEGAEKVSAPAGKRLLGASSTWALYRWEIELLRRSEDAVVAFPPLDGEP